LGDDGIHTYFTSETPDVSRRIIDAVRASVDRAAGRRVDVDILIFAFTDARIADALLELAARPAVHVRIVTDFSQLTPSGGRQPARIEKLARARALGRVWVRYKKDDPYRWDEEKGRPTYHHGSSEGLLHHKGLVTRIDGRVDLLVVGSFNWSVTAESKNYENLVLIEASNPVHRPMMRAFADEFVALFNHPDTLTRRQAAAHKRRVYNRLLDERGLPALQEILVATPPVPYEPPVATPFVDVNAPSDANVAQLTALLRSRDALRGVIYQGATFGPFSSWDDLLGRVGAVARLPAGRLAELEPRLEYGPGRVPLALADAGWFRRALKLSPEAADAIVALRAEQGDLESAEELRGLPGISDAVFRRIRDRLDDDVGRVHFSARAFGDEIATAGYAPANRDRTVPLMGLDGRVDRAAPSLTVAAVDLFRRARPGEVVELALYGFGQDTPEYRELVQAASRGVAFRVVLNRAYNEGVANALKELADGGLPVQVRLMRSRTLHEKFGVVGDDLFQGSANVTRSASGRHSENRFLIKNNAEEAADDPGGPVRVVFTTRDDFVGRLAEVATARQVLGHTTVLRRPEPAALEEILVRTVGAVGYRFEDDELPRQMAAEVQGERAALPLLQFAAHLLWQRRDEAAKTLGRAAYEDMGGVAGALAHHADGILEGMNDTQIAAARLLLLRMVTSDGTRQTRPRGELVEGLGAEVEEVLGRLIDGRLVAARRSLDRRVRRGRGDEAELELVHDSLIRTWGQLARWIDETREERAFLDDVMPAAERWDRRGQHADALWQGDVLADAVRSARRCSGAVPDPIPAFLDAGLAREQQRQTTRRALTIGAISLLALVAVAMSALTYEAQKQRGVAEAQRSEADLQRNEAELQRAAVEREGAAAAFQRGDTVEARAKLRSSLETADSPGARALWWHLRRTPQAWLRELGTMVWAVDVAPDGSTVAVGAQDGLVHLIDVATGTPSALRGHRDQVFAVQYSPDGSLLASGAQDGEVRVREAATGRLVWRADGHEIRVDEVRFTPDGESLVSGSLDGTFAVWGARDGEPGQKFAWGEDGAEGFVLSPDGRQLAAAGHHGQLRVWNLADGQVAKTAIEGGAKIAGLAYHPDGSLLAAAIPGSGIALLDTGDWSTRAVLGADHGPGVVEFNEDGSRLASAGLDLTIRIWDPASEAEIQRFEGHSSLIWGLGFTPSGRHLVSASRDETVRLWDLEAVPSSLVSEGHTSAVTGLAFRPDGGELASASVDGSVRFWDPATGASTREALVQPDEVNQLAYHPDGTLLATSSADARVRLWDLDTRQVDAMITHHEEFSWGVDFSSDGRLFASTDWGGRVVVWDLARGFARHVVDRSPIGIWDVRFRNDGRELVWADDEGRLVTASPIDGRVRRTYSAHDQPRTWAVDYAPDGRTLVSGGDDRAVRITELRTGRSRLLGRLDARIHGTRFHPDGDRVCVTAADGSVFLWPVDGGEPLELAGHRAEANACRFSPDGRLVATSGDDRALRLWDVETGRPFWRAVLLLPDTRTLLTHRGWHDAGGAAVDAPATGWGRAAEGALHGSAAGDGRLCLLGHDGQLQLWDRNRDTRLGEHGAEEPTALVAGPGGCLALLDGGAVVLLDAEGQLRTLGQGGSAVTWDGGEILVAAAGGIHRFGADGTALGARSAEEGASAMAAVEGGLVIGYPEGGFRFVGSGEDATQRTDFEAVPASAVTRVAAGPPGTVIVGFASGALGLWDTGNGGRLHAWELHGAVADAVWSEGHLLATTELGDPLDADLTIYQREHCGVLREVWTDVPLAWEDGHPVVREVPEGHACGD